MNNKDKTWLWQATHERDGWFSTTKTHRNVAFLVSSFIVIFVVIKSSIPALLPELLGLYFGIATGGRIFDRFVSSKVDKGEKNVDPRS